MRALIILALGLTVATGTSARRIVGGSVTTIGQYPFAAALLRSFSGAGTFSQACGGTIINNRAVLTAANCFDSHPHAYQWRVRVGSTYSNSGGVVSTTRRVNVHYGYVTSTLNNDVAVMIINGAFNFNNNVRVAPIAGSNYNVPDNAPAWVIGWGTTSYLGAASVQLRHVQVWVVNQAVCRSRYAERGNTVTDNMLCSGYLDVGGRDACHGDTGGPVIHNGVIVGITSWGYQCGHARFPGVNARVSRFTSWIQNNS
ncbi:trypsin, alkaline B-like [Melitaea cinxia]|uniref:trypsin, alkaline B-like n=1 Tax=Melitaea cinxia TaxID=113334 RepID=UPI001E2737C7|nr:trypsin, alkaline B-like [Melitaea cinxia]